MAEAPQAAFSPQPGGVVRMDGELTVESVPQLYREGRRLIEQADGELSLDLAGVARADSGGLALLVDWLALADQRGKTLRLQNLPEQIRALAGLSEILPLLTGQA